MITVISSTAQAGTYTFGSGSLTTTDPTAAWGGYNSQVFGVGGLGFNLNAGPVTIEFLGVNLGMINYTGDMGWPPDSTDTGATVQVGLLNPNAGGGWIRYNILSNMAGGKGSWDNQGAKYTNDDGYRSYLFQGQYSTAPVGSVYGNSQYNAEKWGGDGSGTNNDYDTFDIKELVQKISPNTYTVTTWHRLWKASSIDEGVTWDWNPAKNAHNPLKREYQMVFEGTWTADGGMNLDEVKPFLAIQNWQYANGPYTFNWDSVKVAGTPVPEPGTMILLSSLVTGLFGTAGIRKRLKRKV